MPIKNLPRVAVLLVSGACATAPASDTGASAQRRPGIAPAELVSSIADVAAGRNAAMREAGIFLRSIEFKLLVGTSTEAGGKVAVLVLEGEAARTSEVSFLQTFVLEVPPAPTKSLAGSPLPEVRAFIETAMETARSIALAAAAHGLPQRLESVELVAKLGASRKTGGGLSFTVPALASASLGVSGSRLAEEVNTIKLVFQRTP